MALCSILLSLIFIVGDEAGVSFAASGVAGADDDPPGDGGSGDGSPTVGDFGIITGNPGFPLNQSALMSCQWCGGSYSNFLKKMAKLQLLSQS